MFSLAAVLSRADVPPGGADALAPQSVAQGTDLGISRGLVRNAVPPASPRDPLNQPAQHQDTQVIPGPAYL